MIAEKPLFASSREALTFAANFNGAGVKASAMNRMLSEMYKADREAQEAEREGLRMPHPMAGWSALDRSGQAGLILQLTGRLPDITVYTMLSAVVKPRDICVCRQPCCCGYRPNNDWIEAVTAVDAALWAFLDVNRAAGKKGNYTLTAVVRVELVRQFFDRQNAQPKSVLAEHFGISEATVASHQKKIGGHLTGMIRTAFTQLDSILVDAGIVGSTD